MKRGARGRCPHLRREQQRVGLRRVLQGCFEAVSDRARVALRTGEQTAPSGIVAIDHGCAQFRPREQTRFGRFIRVERTVVVEVILREIREHGDVERGAVHAPLMQRVRRHFHCHRLSTRVAQLSETALQLRRVGRRETGVHELTGQAGAERADDRATLAQRGQRCRNPLAARGFAVRAGDADRQHAVARIVVPAARNRAGEFVQRRHGERVRRIDCTVEALGLNQHRRRATFKRAVDKRAVICAIDRVGEKHIACCERAGVGVQMRTWLHASVQPGEGVGDLPVRGMLLAQRAHRTTPG